MGITVLVMMMVRGEMLELLGVVKLQEPEVVGVRVGVGVEEEDVVAVVALILVAFGVVRLLQLQQ
jgi:hypothetical protein